MILGILCGLATGVFSGLVGVGGGIIMIPIMTMLFGFSQHMAQGTSLAVMLPPIGIFAVWAYHKQGMVDLPMAGWIILGFVLGGWLGGKFAVLVPEFWLKKIFGMTMIFMGIKFVFFK
ncbi:MAG: permease [Rickettsiales bacterium]|nr:permease [Rickettsiales bacterium]